MLSGHDSLLHQLRVLCQQQSPCLLLIWLQVLAAVAALFLRHSQQSLWNSPGIFNLGCHVGSQLSFLPGLFSGPALALTPTPPQVQFPLSELQLPDSAKVPALV